MVLKNLIPIGRYLANKIIIYYEIFLTKRSSKLKIFSVISEMLDKCYVTIINKNHRLKIMDSPICEESTNWLRCKELEMLYCIV